MSVLFATVVRLTTYPPAPGKHGFAGKSKDGTLHALSSRTNCTSFPASFTGALVQVALARSAVSVALITA